MNKILRSAAVFIVAQCLISNVHAGAIACDKFEVGFSPEGGAEDLVLRVIGSARTDVKILAYSFTSRTVVQALVAAKKRGATVSLVADASNLTSKPGTAAMSTLTNAGAAVRTIGTYKIMHDKVVIVDGKTIEFGSFNYSQAAAMSNSENANACWNSPEVARTYLQHWQSRWNQGSDFHTRY